MMRGRGTSWLTFIFCFFCLLIVIVSSQNASISLPGQYIFSAGRVQRTNIDWNDVRGNVVYLDGRTIRLIGSPRVFDSAAGRGIILDGRTQYVDLGDDLTCGGNLDDCPQGFTLRMMLHPDELEDNMYFLGSFPISLYYNNGLLYSLVRTPTREWIASTPGLRAREWQLVEVTWDQETGITLYLNGRRVAHRLLPEHKVVPLDYNRRTYLGRALSDIVQQKYARGIVELVEVWNAKRSYLLSSNLIRPGDDMVLATTRRPPPTTAQPTRIITTFDRTLSGKYKTIRFGEYSYIYSDLKNLPQEAVQHFDEEEFYFVFAGNNPDGLIWYQKNIDGQTYFVTFRDGQPTLSIDEGTGRPIHVSLPGRYDDGGSHRLKIHRKRNVVTFEIDGQSRSFPITDRFQLMQRSDVYFGGSPDTRGYTNGRATRGFSGIVGDILYKGSGGYVDAEINVMTSLSATHGTLDFETHTPPQWTYPTTPYIRPTRPTRFTWPTRPTHPTRPTTRPTPRTRPTRPFVDSLTFTTHEAYMRLPALFRYGYSLSFQFRTFEPNGLLLYAGSGSNNPLFVALEMFDGKLYFVYNLGESTKRVEVSEQRIDDGKTHQMKISIGNNMITLHLDGQRKQIPLLNSERIDNQFKSSTYVGGIDERMRLPWHVWSREGFQGCFSDLRINESPLNLNDYYHTGSRTGIEHGCRQTRRFCQDRHCRNGFCRDRWNDYYCDCLATPYTGKNCDEVAKLGVFNGTFQGAVHVIGGTRRNHVNDISVRFNTPISDTLLFEGISRYPGDYITGALRDGKAVVDLKLGGVRREIEAGENLNDGNWHVLHVKRRGNRVEVWVDDEKDKTLVDDFPDKEFYFDIDRIYVGRLSDDISYVDIPGYYVGYIQNFHFDDVDVMGELPPWFLQKYMEPLPSIMYKPVTFRKKSTFVKLPKLKVHPNMRLSFMMKTKEPNGLILFNGGDNQEFIAVELTDGRIRYALDSGNGVRATTVPGPKLNDDKWHQVTITAINNKHMVKVDEVTDDNIGRGSMPDLKGQLYIGGVPKTIYDIDYVSNGIQSKKGFSGCLASVELVGTAPDLYDFSERDGVHTLLRGCTDIVVIPEACLPTTCLNGGICRTIGTDRFKCDCTYTGYTGTKCEKMAVGVRFMEKYKKGLLVYEFPPDQYPDSNNDTIILGFMTWMENGTLARIHSDIFHKDFIELRMENGFVVAEYNINDNYHKLVQDARKYNDGQYHIVKFVRGTKNGRLFVDSLKPIKAVHTGKKALFARIKTIYGGGYRTHRGGEVIHNPFNGIIAGMSYIYGNGRIPVINLVDKGHAHANIHYDSGLVYPPFVLPKPDTTPPPTPKVPILGAIPPHVGGGGAAWVPNTVPGGGGEILVAGGPGFGGSGGSGMVVPGVASPVAGAATGVAVAGFLPTTGVRAGALLGSILGIFAAVSGLTWAFYKCKPGWCSCVKPPKTASPMSISTPRTTSNLAVVQQSGFAAGGGGASASGGGTKLTVVDGGGGAYDSATLRSTGTFTNKGTAIGTPTASRANLGSASSAGGYGGGGGGYTANYSSSSTMITQNVGGGGGGGGGGGYGSAFQYESGADYDHAVGGSGANYQSNTLAVGGGPRGGSVSSYQGGQSGSTMQSSYNYHVANYRTVYVNRHGQQVLGYIPQPSGLITPGGGAEEVRVDCCLISSDGHSVVTGSSLGAPQVWDMQTGELMRMMQGDTVGSTHLHLACNDSTLVGAVHADLEINDYSSKKGVINHQLQIWDFGSGRPLEMEEPQYCSALAVMPDNDKVVFGRSDKYGSSTNIIVWDLMGNQLIKSMNYDAPVGNNDYICYINISKNNRFIVAGFSNTIDDYGEFVVFDMSLTSNNIVEPSLLRLDANPECTAILPRDEAVTGLRNGDLVIWSLRTGQPSRQLLSDAGRHAHTMEVKAVELSKDGKYLVSASADGTMKVWDMSSERELHTLRGHKDEVWCCSISPDSDIVVSGSKDATIRVWRLRNGSEICNFNTGVDVFTIKMSNDKKTIVALGDKFGARKLIMLQIVRTKIRRTVST